MSQHQLAVLECVICYNIAMLTRKGFSSLLFIVAIFSDLSNLKLLSSVPGRDGNRKEFGDSVSDSPERFRFLKIRLVFFKLTACHLLFSAICRQMT